VTTKPCYDPTRVPEQHAFGARLRAARQAQDRSLAWVGQHLDPPVTHPAVLGIEQGKTTISLDKMHELARLLDVPLAWLLGVEAEPAGGPAPDSRTLTARVTALEGALADLRAQIGGPS
jgi:transcriptional regulator with XRE-family HTH domain